MSFHDWVEKNVGLKCASTFTPNYCDIDIETIVGHDRGIIGLSLEGKNIAVETDVVTEVAPGGLPCAWESDQMEYASERCFDMKDDDERDACQERAEEEYFREGRFNDCSEMNVKWMEDNREGVFVDECPLSEVHEHGGDAHLHYKCMVPMRGEEVRGLAFAIIGATQDKETVAKLKREAAARRRRE